MFKPKVFADDWRMRWMHVGRRGLLLHRVAKGSSGRSKTVFQHGVAVCGLRGIMEMPGIFSRMGARRCKNCCRILGVPQGDGAPYNDTGLPPKQKNA